MGSFSWTRADITTERSNICEGDKYKILVPAKFGGGFIQDIYMDYGYVFDLKNESDYPCYIDASGKKFCGKEFPVNDLYGILAWWNGVKPKTYSSDLNPSTMVEILKNGETNGDVRGCGIAIGCYDEQIDRLEFPLKLVSTSFKGTYESCAGRSYGDPNQGFFAARWEDDEYYRNIRARLSRLQQISSF